MFRLVSTLAVAALLLAGCYRSSVLLLDQTRAMPLQSGSYSNGSYKYDLVSRQDGAYDLYSYGADGVRLANPEMLVLNRAPELETGVSQVYFYGDASTLEWDYGLLVIQGGAIYEVHPDCGGQTAADIAKGEGADINCDFTDSDALRRALRRYFRVGTWSAPYYRQ